MSAVEVRGRGLHRYVDVAARRIGGEGRPRPGVARVLPALLAPGVRAEVAGLRHRVERPPLGAASHVVAANPAGHGDLGAGCSARGERGPDHHDISDDDRRGARARRRLRQITGARQADFQIDDTRPAEGANRPPRARIERDELKAGRDHEHPARLPPTFAPPIRDTPTRVPARCDGAALALVKAVHPERLTARRVDRDHIAANAGSDVEGAVRHQGRRAVIVLGGGAEIVRLPAPDDAQLLDVVSIDLIEGGVARTPEIAAIVQPLRQRERLLALAGGEQLGRRHDPAVDPANIGESSCVISVPQGAGIRGRHPLAHEIVERGWRERGPALLEGAADQGRPGLPAAKLGPVTSGAAPQVCIIRGARGELRGKGEKQARAHRRKCPVPGQGANHLALSRSANR